MFIYGNNENGRNTCNKDDGCHCICETSADPKGTCPEIDHSGFNLYRFEEYSGGKHIYNQFNYVNILIRFMIFRF